MATVYTASAWLAVTLALTLPSRSQAQATPAIQCSMTLVPLTSGLTARVRLTNVGSVGMQLTGALVAQEPNALLLVSQSAGELQPDDSLECIAGTPADLPAGAWKEFDVPIEARFNLAPSTNHFVALAAPVQVVIGNTPVQDFTPDCGGLQFVSSSVGSTAQPLVNSSVNSCSSAKKTIWRNAQRVARYITQARISHAVSQPVGGPTHWVLGRFLERSPTLTSQIANLYNSRIDEIHANLADDEGAAVKCIEGTQLTRCSDKKTLASARIVYIHLCDNFFNGLDILGQAATLVHEVTHMEHDTVDRDSANDDARLSDIMDPYNIFRGAKTQRDSTTTEICSKLNSGAEAFCVGISALGGAFFVAHKCDDKFNCYKVPQDVAGVWEAITHALVLDHFIELYQNNFGRRPTELELKTELERIHVGKSPIDEFAELHAVRTRYTSYLGRSAHGYELEDELRRLRSGSDPAAELDGIAWYMGRMSDTGAPGSATYADGFLRVRDYADNFGSAELEAILSAARALDPSTPVGGARLEDVLRFMDEGLPGSTDAGRFFSGLFTAKVLATLGG